MANTDLQNQLGLGLAVKQANEMAGNQNYSVGYTSPSGKQGYAVSLAPKETPIVELGGGSAILGSNSTAQNTNPISSGNDNSSSYSVPSSSGATVTTETSSPSVINNPSTYSSGGLSNSGSLLNTSGTKTERVKAAKANYDSLMAKRNELMTADPTLGRYDAMKKARGLLQGTTPSVSNTPVNSDPYGLNRINSPELYNTGDSLVDSTAKKLKDITDEKLKEEFQSYAVMQGDIAKNKGYYTNFDATNNTFNGVIGDIQAVLSKSGQTMLSEQEKQSIASKYGISVDEVTDPTSIYKNLQLTDEGKKESGITSAENKITDLKTEYDRKKEDATIQNERNETAYKQKIADTQQKTEQDIRYMEAYGAWNGASKSSGYIQGINNVHTEGEKLIGRIYEQIGYGDADTATYLSRLSDDFTTNTVRATDELNTSVEKLKFSMGLQLNGLEKQYGEDSKGLSRALDKIMEDFGTSYQSIVSKNYEIKSTILENVMKNINLIEKMNTVNDAMKNKRYNEIVKDGLLANISLTNIADEVRAGKMDASKYADLKNLMTKTVVDTLSKSKTLTQADINTIGYLLDNGATPTQIVARLGGGSTIAPTTGVPTLLDMISKAEGTHGNYNGMYGAGAQTDIDLTKMTVKQVQDLQRKRIYQDKNGNWVGGAMGKYQVVSGTLNGLVQRGVVKPTDLFNAETQDKIAMSLMGSSWADYQSGKITPEEFQRKLSKIWASVPDPSTGQSVYASDGTNSVTKGGGEIGEFLRSGGAIQANSSKNYSQDQKNLMDTITGELTEAKISTLKAGGLGVQDLANYRASSMSSSPSLMTGDFTQSEVEQFKGYNGNTIPEEYKTKAEQASFLARLSEWQSQGNLTKTERADVKDVRTNLEQDSAYKAGLELMPKYKTLSGIQNRLKTGSATPQDKQQLINDFAKILDPTSVVREGEYALAGKYSQSKLESYGQEIKNFFTTGGPLSDEAAEMLAEGVSRRFDAIITEYDGSIDRAMNSAKFYLQRDIPIQALQVEYSPMREVKTNSSTSTSQATVDSIYDEIINL